MNKLMVAFGIALSTLLPACGGDEVADDPGADDVAVSTAELRACNAPVAAHATFLNGDGTGAPVTNYVSAVVRSTSNPRGSTYWIENTGLQLVSTGPCSGFICTGFTTRQYIHGNYNGRITVDVEGNVLLPGGVRVTPSSCVQPTASSTVIQGTGSDGRAYTITLQNQWLG